MNIKNRAKVDGKDFNEKVEQAEAEVVPSSSLVEVEVGVEVEVEVGIEVEVGVEVKLKCSYIKFA